MKGTSESTQQALQAECEQLRQRVAELEALQVVADQREKHARQYQAALVELARKQYHMSHLKVFLENMTETFSTLMDVERVSVWICTDTPPGIRCLDLYLRTTDEHTDGLELHAEHYPQYFHALEQQRVIAAHNAFTDPATFEFADYLSAFGIGAMLDVPIRRGGKLSGVVCLEHVGGARQWTLDEEVMTGSFTDLVAMAMETERRRQLEAELYQSQMMLHSIIDNAPVAIAVKDRTGHMMLVNQYYCALLQLKEEQIIGKTEFDLFPEAVARAWREIDDQVAATAQAIQAEEVAPHVVDKQVHTYVSNKFPIIDELGRVMATGIVATDITDRKRSEEALRTFQALVENATDGIALINPEHVLVYANQTFQHLFGYSTDLTGQAISTIIALEAREQLQQMIAQVREQGHWQGDMCCLRQNGQVFPGQVTAFVLPHEDRQHAVIATIVRDMTSQYAFQEQMRIFKTLVDYAPDMIFVSDNQPLGQRQITYHNRAFTETIGYDIHREFVSLLNLLPLERDRLPEINAAVELHNHWQGRLTYTRKMVRPSRQRFQSFLYVMNRVLRVPVRCYCTI
ncbi:MAG: PAS domain S-box protein [Chloroflexaceae bacterium]|nr:PAS domain S-box protein [Chloroflexaceae bacterium]